MATYFGHDDEQDHDDDDDDQENEGGGKNRGNRKNNKNNRSKGNKNQPNAATDSNLAFSYVKELLEMLAFDLGEEGYDKTWVSTAIAACEKLFGKGVTDNVVFPGLAVLLSDTSFFRNALKLVIPSDQMGDIVFESLDGYIEGVRSGHSHSGGKTISRKHHDDAMGKARSVLKAKLSERTFADVVLLLLTKDEQIKLDKLVKKLSSDAETKKRFDFQRKNLRRREVLRAVLDRFQVGITVVNGVDMEVLVGAEEILPYLERTFGDAPKPSAAKGFLEKIWKKVEDTFDNLMKPMSEPEKKQLATKREAIRKDTTTIRRRRAFGKY